MIKRISKLSVIFLWALIFYLQYARPFMAHIAVNISPLLLISVLYHSIFWVIWLSIPILIFALFKGRAFCWHICPVGLIQDFIPSKNKAKPSRLNLYIFLGLLIASFFGLNLLAVFDPLVTFNKIVIIFGLQLGELVLFILPISIIIFLNIFRKRFWCFKLCPLGAFLDWLTILKGKSKFDIKKRNTLIAIGSGLAAGILIRHKKIFTGTINERLLRPPGALPEHEFIDRCIRCGSCISICLTSTLTPSFFEGGLSGIFSPKLVPQISECDEYCNKCGQACPTQAIRNLPLDVKSRFKIGTARIERSKCIAWSKNSLCLVCQEFCPYLAIKIVKNDNRTPCPEVISALCRGCGHCEKNCPARPGRAIKVFNERAGEIIKT